VKPRSQDSDDIERAVYDGMQDLRAAQPKQNRGQTPISTKRDRKPAKRRARSR